MAPEQVAEWAEAKVAAEVKAVAAPEQDREETAFVPAVVKRLCTKREFPVMTRSVPSAVPPWRGNSIWKTR
ncbi:conserved hypothetical protein [delta proteobacterium NaphS2]|nr:conserved hypothetical protein [delta proteobacterium NaphS2]